MSQLSTAINESLQLSLGYAKRLLKDITSEQFARFASVGDQQVVSNHASFVYGHLALYGPRVLEQLGHDAPVVPAKFEEVFSQTATCVDDPDGSIYPAMAEVTELFFSSYEAAGKAILATPDATWQQPNPGSGRIVELFPTLGSMQNFYVGGHVMMHMGQLSAWRRMMGLGAA